MIVFTDLRIRDKVQSSCPQYFAVDKVKEGDSDDDLENEDIVEVAASIGRSCERSSI